MVLKRIKKLIPKGNANIVTVATPNNPEVIAEYYRTFGHIPIQIPTRKRNLLIVFKQGSSMKAIKSKLKKIQELL